MNSLFSPCTRYRDSLDSQGLPPNTFNQKLRDHLDLLQELNLDVSTEELLSADRAFTFADLFAVLGNRNTVAWLTPHTAIFREYGLAKDSFDLMVDGPCYRYSFNADGKHLYAMAHSSEALSEICNVVLRLLAASVVRSVLIVRRTHEDVFINAANLAHLMEQCQSLKTLTLEDLQMDEHSVRALGAAFSRSGLKMPSIEVVLVRCTLTVAAISALAEIIASNQGPIRLDYCNIDNFVLADGLRGNSCMKSLNPRFSNNLEVGNREVLAIAGALRENKGLVVLKLRYVRMAVNDEIWDAVCDSLKTHPTLQVLDLRRVGEAPSVPARLKSRIQALVNMLEMNRSIHTIHLNSSLYSEHELFLRSVVPYLETNRFRPTILAIQKIRPMAYRAKLLGRALFATRADANRLWMLLSGNPEVAFSSTIATTTPATNPPAPATATATLNTGAPVAACVATPITCQKRKTHP
jgi:hypothetical protein